MLCACACACVCVSVCVRERVRSFFHPFIPLISDVLLLTDIVQDFRRLIYSYYNLEALRFVSLPALSLSAALKFTGVHLQQLSSPEMYLFWEGAKR